MSNPKRRVVLELDDRPRLRAVIDRLHDKTGMRSAPDMILVALLDFDAKLPLAPVTTNQPDQPASQNNKKAATHGTSARAKATN